MKNPRDWSGWHQALLEGGVVPYSFRCDGKRVDADGAAAGAGLVAVECTPTIFAESGCVEWTFGLRNTGGEDSPVLSELHSLDLSLPLLPEFEWAKVHFVVGAHWAKPSALEAIDLAHCGKAWRINNPGGGKTHLHLPFLNLDLGDHGLFVALGWPGRWAIRIERDEAGGLRLMAGIERAELSLHPGEAIRLPKVLVMFWEGDRLAAHNRFRQHILKHHSPTLNGEPAPDILACATWGGMKTHNHLKLIEALKKNDAGFDCYWIDAAWYGAPHETEEYQSLRTEDWFHHVGDWRPNTVVHPAGLKPISDAARAAGMKFLLWFEVERAVDSVPWVQEHPDWYFSRRSVSHVGGRDCPWRVFDFGNPEARQAMTDQIAGVIEENGIDVFRQDCNVGLSECWDEHDTPGRIGMAEIRYVEGLLAFWSELKARIPHLLFDIVQRRDLSSLAFTLDLSRSDHEFHPHTDPISSQVAQHGLSHWTPLSGTIMQYATGNDYKLLSALSSSMGTALFPSIGYDPVSVEPPADYPWAWLKRMLGIFRRARPFFRGDFQPLTGVIDCSQCWGAMQYHRADLGQGMVVVYRRPDSPFTEAQFQLQGMDAATACRIEATENGEFNLSGTLLEVRLHEAPTAAVMFYSQEN